MKSLGHGCRGDAENICPVCSKREPCWALHFGARRHRHVTCSIACGRRREARRRKARAA